MYLAGPFASNGRAGVAFLKVKLSQAKGDLTIHNIIFLLREISIQETYDVRGDNDLMRLMANSIARIKNEDWRRISREMVNQIKGVRENP